MWVPPGEPHPDADAAIELCDSLDFVLDPWQQLVLRKSLRRRGPKWAAFEVGLVMPRQNGKNAVIEARELAGLFLLGERLIVHSAHQFDTSLEAFRRLLYWIENFDWLSAQVKRTPKAHGEEGIELKDGRRVRFRTRTKGGGRGFTSDCLVLDEAMILPESAHGALLPTLSARPDPQVWYAGSAVDREIHDDGFVLSRVRRRGVEGNDPKLAYFEWSLDHESPAVLPPEVANDPAAWAQANPGYGIRIAEEHIDAERRAMDARTFAVERLGVGDWPADGEAAVIDLDLWDSLTDAHSEITGPVVFAFDVSPDRSTASVAASGYRGDDNIHVELAARDRGVGWLTSWLPERIERHKAAIVVCDAAGPAGSIVEELERRMKEYARKGTRVDIVPVNAREYAQACGNFVDLAAEHRLRHTGQSELRAALRGAAQRTLGDAWAWSRRSSGVDISPLVAATLAAWAVPDAKRKTRVLSFS